jgi:Uma2 family endonuclease
MNFHSSIPSRNAQEAWGKQKGSQLDSSGINYPVNHPLAPEIVVNLQKRIERARLLESISHHAIMSATPATFSPEEEMSAAPKWNLVSIKEYLANELRSPIKHEYLGGVVYAMAGARTQHNRIAMNTKGHLFRRLHGRSCEVFDSDMKIRVQLPTQTRFYYPDASVVCRPNPPEDSFQDNPAALFEVLSQSTRRIDDGEKKDAYLSIPSLRVYALIEQESPTVIVFRRTEAGFVREVYAGLDAIIPLGEIGIELPLAEIYERIEFRPEPESGES